MAEGQVPQARPGLSRSRASVGPACLGSGPLWPHLQGRQPSLGAVQGPPRGEGLLGRGPWKAGPSRGRPGQPPGPKREDRPLRLRGGLSREGCSVAIPNPRGRQGTCSPRDSPHHRSPSPDPQSAWGARVSHRRGPQVWRALALPFSDLGPPGPVPHLQTSNQTGGYLFRLSYAGRLAVAIPQGVKRTLNLFLAPLPSASVSFLCVVFGARFRAAFQSSCAFPSEFSFAWSLVCCLLIGTRHPAARSCLPKKSPKISRYRL